MQQVKILIIALAVAAVAAGCGKKTQTVFPLPEGYPRPDLPDTALVECDKAPLSFWVNEQCEVSSERPGWLDIRYPTLRATVHLTFTHSSTDEIETVKANRMQRLMMNAGDASMDFVEFASAGGFDVVGVSSEGTATPFQFLATDNDKWVVSGSVYFADAGSGYSVDSLRPSVKAIRNDLLRALNRLDVK